MVYINYIFFFKQKTAYEMRISDWSSDVCSSDLPDFGAFPNLGFAVDTGTKMNADVSAERPVDAPALIAFYRLSPFLQATCCLIEDAQHAAAFQSVRERALARGTAVAKMLTLGSQRLRSETRRVGTECVSQCRLRW